MVPLSLIHLAVVLLAWHIAWEHFRARLTLLNFTLLGYLALCSFGLVFAPYMLPLLDVPNNEIPFLCGQDPSLYARQILGHWCFLAVPILVMVSSRVWHPRVLPIMVSTWAAERPAMFLFKWGLFGAALLLSAKLYLVGPGVEKLMGSRLLFETSAEAIASRKLGKEMLDIRQGAFMALTAANIFMPLTACLALQKSRRCDWLIFLSCALGSLAYGFQTRQKSPVVLTIIIYVMVALVSKSDAKRLYAAIRSKRVLIWIFVAAFFLVALSYFVNYGQSAALSVGSALLRLFLVPCYTETNYFVIFPDTFPYRGLGHVFSMTLGQWGETSDVTIYDVALAISGTKYSANASVVAIAWSGIGYVGIALVSLILTVLLVALDRNLARYDTTTRALTLVLSLGSMLAIVSGGLMDYLSSGGVLLPGLLLIVLGYAPRRLVRRGRLAVRKRHWYQKG